MKQYFGIDIGGTAVKLGIVDETGKVLCKGEQSVNFDGYQTPVLDTVRKAAKEFLTAQAIPVENLSGIGVSATGQIDSRKGIVAGTCGNFPNYIGSPIKAALEQDFGLHDPWRSMGRRGTGLYRRHRCDAGHRRGRWHPDRRPPAGRCPRSWR